MVKKHENRHLQSGRLEACAYLPMVNGCFWHGHDCPRGARVPKRNADYWRAKIARNVVRDAEQQAALAARGWAALTVWECALKDREALAAELVAFLGPPGITSASTPPRSADPSR